MILNPGELVVEDCVSYAEIREELSAHGYKMYHGGTLPDRSCFIGFRYDPSSNFPECLLCVDRNQVESVKNGKTLDSAVRYTIIHGDEMMRRSTQSVLIEDFM